jgi:rubrerythrin
MLEQMMAFSMNAPSPASTEAFSSGILFQLDPQSGVITPAQSGNGDGSSNSREPAARVGGTCEQPSPQEVTEEVSFSRVLPGRERRRRTSTEKVTPSWETTREFRMLSSRIQDLETKLEDVRENPPALFEGVEFDAWEQLIAVLEAQLAEARNLIADPRRSAKEGGSERQMAASTSDPQRSHEDALVAHQMAASTTETQPPLAAVKRNVSSRDLVGTRITVKTIPGRPDLDNEEAIVEAFNGDTHFFQIEIESSEELVNNVKLEHLMNYPAVTTSNAAAGSSSVADLLVWEGKGNREIPEAAPGAAPAGREPMPPPTYSAAMETWSCGVCTFDNATSSQICAVCGVGTKPAHMMDVGSSNPIDNRGLDRLLLDCQMEGRCPSCGDTTELSFEEFVVRSRQELSDSCSDDGGVQLAGQTPLLEVLRGVRTMPEDIFLEFTGYERSTGSANAVADMEAMFRDQSQHGKGGERWMCWACRESY